MRTAPRKNKRKVLLYGFGPYANYKSNITEELLKSLPDTAGVSKKIFKTCFDQKMFLRSLEQHKPEYIIGLGQSPRARKINIERKAVNYWAEANKKRRKISKHGPEKHYLKLKIPKDPLSTISYDAGIYVCNFSMYLSAEYCSEHNASSAFLHIPKNANIKSVQRFIIRITKAL